MSKFLKSQWSTLVYTALVVLYLHPWTFEPHADPTRGLLFSGATGVACWGVVNLLGIIELTSARMATLALTLLCGCLGYALALKALIWTAMWGSESILGDWIFDGFGNDAMVLFGGSLFGLLATAIGVRVFQTKTETR